MTVAVILAVILVIALLLLPTRRQVIQKVREVTGMKISLGMAVEKLSLAIAMFETGWRGDILEFPALDASQWSGRARKNLNPGNLQLSGLKGKAIGKDSQGYVIFATARDGWEALKRDVNWKLSGHSATGLGPKSTLRQFITVYAPPPINPTTEYVKFVSQQTGLPPDIPFSEVIDYA